MALLIDTYAFGDFTLSLCEEDLFLSNTKGQQITIRPSSTTEAHDWALMLRRAARRLEAIGRGMEPKPYIRPEDDPSRCAYNREAWKAAR